jgi:tetratricopeptide (TPR) repeat protein
MVEIALADQLRGSGRIERAAEVLAGLLEDELEPSDRAIVLVDLGRIRTGQHRFEEAHSLLAEALELRRELDGEQHPTFANTLDALGNLLQSEDDLQRAEQRFREALEIRRQIFEPDHPDIAAGLENLGTLLGARGEHERGEALLEEAWHIYERALGADNLNTARVLSELGRSKVERGACDDAVPLLRRSFDVHRGLGLEPRAIIEESLAKCGAAPEVGLSLK